MNIKQIFFPALAQYFQHMIEMANQDDFLIECEVKLGTVLHDFIHEGKTGEAVNAVTILGMLALEMGNTMVVAGSPG